MNRGQVADRVPEAAALPAHRFDVHQHRWSEPLVAELARRAVPPRLRKRGDGWWLELPHEPPSRIDPSADGGAARAALNTRDGIDRALIAHSPALGLDAIDPDSAQTLALAHAEGCRELPRESFGWWAAVPLCAADAAAVDAALAAGAVGVCLPSGAFATPEALAPLAPLLGRLAARDAPLFVHPGPGRGRPPAGPGVPSPAWWPALADYVPGMHVAWHAWTAAGARAAYPTLRVLWAMLAGLAPLHRERLTARGGPASATDDANAFYDTSSYGPAARSALAGAVGPERLVYGSDRPVITPGSPPAFAGEEPTWDALTRDNPARLLGPPTSALGRTSSAAAAR